MKALRRTERPGVGPRQSIARLAALVFVFTVCQCDRSFDFLECSDRRAGLTCGLTPQCGCEVIERCAIVRNGGSVPGTRSCVPIGEGRDGAGCTGTAGCARGYECWNGSCRLLCDPGDPTSCGTARVCVQLTGDNGLQVQGGGACFGEQCDPLNGSPCDADRSCTAFSYEHASLTQPFVGTACIVAGPGRQRDACGNVYDCARNFVCAAATCRRSCRVGHNDDCSASGADDTCNGWRIREVVAGVEYGFCGTAGEQG